MFESRELQIYGKIKKNEYAHQIPEFNNIENHNRVQIITSFAYFMNMFKI